MGILQQHELVCMQVAPSQVIRFCLLAGKLVMIGLQGSDRKSHKPIDI